MYEDTYREFNNNLLWFNIDGRYREQRHFVEAMLNFVFNIVELNPSDKVGGIIHQLLKSYFFEKPEYRRGVYKKIRYIILPVLWKDHRAIERKKQRKLTFLANELDTAGRTIEAHVVRTIMKPYVRAMNRKWSKMSALEKLITVWPS